MTNLTQLLTANLRDIQPVLTRSNVDQARNVESLAPTSQGPEHRMLDLACAMKQRFELVKQAADAPQDKAAWEALRSFDATHRPITMQAADLSALLFSSGDSEKPDLPILAALRTDAEGNLGLMDGEIAGNDETIISNPFHKELFEALERLKSGWQGKYEQALASFIETYKMILDAMAKLKDATTADPKDANYINVNFDEVKKALEDAIDRIEELADFPTKEEAQRFANSFGTPDFVVHEVLKDGKFVYIVVYDNTTLQSLLNSMPSGKQRWDTAKHSAWVAAKDGYMERIQHISQVLGEKMSRVNQEFDTLVKILSATIDSDSQTNHQLAANLS